VSETVPFHCGREQESGDQEPRQYEQNVNTDLTALEKRDAGMAERHDEDSHGSRAWR
jgi:hypothetical protein